jgi:hypothetical protein
VVSAGRLAGLDLLRGIAIDPRGAPAGLTLLLVLSVVPLRGSAFTYLAGGPAIAVLTSVLLLTWGRLAVGLTLAAALSWRYVEGSLQQRRERVPVTA